MQSATDEEPEPVLPPTISSDEILSLKSSILKYISAKIDTDLKNFEGRFRDEMDMRTATVRHCCSTEIDTQCLRPPVDD